MKKSRVRDEIDEMFPKQRRGFISKKKTWQRNSKIDKKITTIAIS